MVVDLIEVEKAMREIAIMIKRLWDTTKELFYQLKNIVYNKDKPKPSPPKLFSMQSQIHCRKPLMICVRNTC